MKFRALFLVLVLVLISACSDSKKAQEELTDGGYPKASGTYSVVSSTCPFVESGGGFSISQNDASLSISTSGLVENLTTDQGTLNNDGSEQIGGADLSVANAEVEISSKVSFASAGISKEGEVSLTVSKGSIAYICVGTYALGSVALTCDGNSDQTTECSLSASKVSDDAHEIQQPTSDELGGGAGYLQDPQPLDDAPGLTLDSEAENADADDSQLGPPWAKVVGSWCKGDGNADYLALYIGPSMKIQTAEDIVNGNL